MDNYHAGFNNFMGAIDSSIQNRMKQQDMIRQQQVADRQNKIADMQIQKYMEEQAQQKQQLAERNAYISRFKGIPTTEAGVGPDPMAFNQAMEQWRQTSTPTPLMNPQFGPEANLMAEMGTPVQSNYQMLPDQSNFTQPTMLPRDPKAIYKDQLGVAMEAALSGNKVGSDLDNYLKMSAPEFQPSVQTVGDLQVYGMAPGKYEFAPKAEKPAELWSEPYEGNIGGKKVMLKRNVVTNEVKPVVSDTSTTVRVNASGEGNLAQSTFVTPDGKPLVYDKKTGSYRPAVVEGGGTVVPKPNAISPEAATRLQQFDTVINSMPRLRTLVFDKEGNINKYDIANAAVGMPFTKGREMKQVVKRTIEQVLRIATGAAAPDSEVSSYMDMYSPQIGDTKEMIAAKFDALEASARGARDLASQGRSVAKYAMAPVGGGSSPSPSASSKVETRISADGKFKLTKDAAGNISKTRIK